MDGSDNALLALARKVDLIWITGLHAYAYTGPSLSGSLFGENTLYVWEWDQAKESRAQRDQEKEEEEEESPKCSNQSPILSSTSSSSSSYSILKRDPFFLWFPFWRIYLFLFLFFLNLSYGVDADGCSLALWWWWWWWRPAKRSTDDGRSRTRDIFAQSALSFGSQ